MTPQPPRATILVLGGYGAFGSRIAERLARDASLTVVIAGRSQAKAQAAAERLARSAEAAVRSVVLDAMHPDADTLAELAPVVVINASGPYQAQNYALARAAIACRAHYIDLADARGFVTGITALDADARAHDVLVTSGASSVPALAAAIVDHLLPEFEKLHTIHHGISPANGYDPGPATTASILGGLGQPIAMLIDGRWRRVHGWLGLWRCRFPGLGGRWMAHCDVPDLGLFPQRYPDVTTVRFSAGLEVGLFQLGLWALAWLARLGIVRRPERLAPMLMKLKRAFSFLGSDEGGMFVRLTGTSREGAGRERVLIERSVHLVARSNQGPYVPAIVSIVLARKLVRGEVTSKGAMPCLGFVTLDEIEAEFADLDIAIEVAPANSSSPRPTAMR